MDTETNYQLEDLNNADDFNCIIFKILNKIHFAIEQQISDLGFVQDGDFEWLQYWPSFYTPQFQHLSFRLKHVIYSLRIVIYDFDSRYIFLPNANEEAQLYECRNNNLQACIVSIDINAINDPIIVFTETQEEVDFSKLNDIDSGNMSEWEINHYAVDHVLRYLKSIGSSDIQFTDAPTFVPQIFCTINGIPSFVYVNGHVIATPSKPISKSQCDRLSNLQGYYADVPLTFLLGNSGDFQDKVIYRGCPGSNLVYQKITEENPLLIPIESAFEEYGYYECELFDVEIDNPFSKKDVE